MSFDHIFGGIPENVMNFYFLNIRINPVTGCYEEPKPDPMAGMTQEQKEYEATRLVEMIDKLAKSTSLEHITRAHQNRSLIWQLFRTGLLTNH